MRDSIQPVVLVGGASRRFGRDKLREPVGEGWLVDRPIAALREVFGRRVCAVGDCDPAIAARADLHQRDRFPGAGPIGGIITAIERFGSDVFVLPGDVPAITAEVVRAVLAGGDGAAASYAVWARTSRPEPCIGVYRVTALAELRTRLAGGRSLKGLLDGGRITLVAVPEADAVNANTPDALRAALDGRKSWESGG